MKHFSFVFHHLPVRLKCLVIGVAMALLLSLWLSSHAFGQAHVQVIQFSGIILGEDSLSGVPNVHIFVPKSGRGTTTNHYGYFSIPVLENDSLMISAIGYKKKYVAIPRTERYHYTVIIELTPDITYLPEVEVYPYPTEELLKQAILAFEAPLPYSSSQQRLNQTMLNQMYKNLPTGIQGNYNSYLNQYANTYNRGFQANTFSLLNPFAWAQFIKSLKKNKRSKP